MFYNAAIQMQSNVPRLGGKSGSVDGKCKSGRAIWNTVKQALIHWKEGQWNVVPAMAEERIQLVN